MAIGLDATAVSTDQTASPLTWNHTCTGFNLLLVVGVTHISTVTISTTTAVTYNGVAMTKIRSDQNSAGLESSIWFLANPDTGTHQISATATLGTNPHLAGISASYTGAQQNNLADTSGTSTGTVTGDSTISLITVLNNTWIFAVGINAATVGPTLAADQTSRGTVSIASGTPAILRGEDTNAAQTPPGAKSIGMNPGATAGELAFVISAVSFGPAPEPMIINNYQFVKVRDGMSATEKIR